MDAKDRIAVHNKLSVEIPWPTKYFDELVAWGSLMSDGNRVLSVEVKSEVNGNEVESTKITFDDWSS